MNVRVKEIEERVIALLDENLEIVEERTIYGDPATELGALIRQLIPDAATAVIKEADVSMIDESLSGSGSGLLVGPGGRMLMPLPNRFLRLLNFRMDSWDRGLNSLLDPWSEEYSLRIRSGRIRPGHRSGPALSIAYVGTGRMLEIFGAEPGARVAEFAWLPAPEIEDGRIWIPSLLLDALCRKTAEFVKAVTNHLDD